MERILIDNTVVKLLVNTLTSFKGGINLKELNLNEHFINDVRAEFENSILIDAIIKKINDNGYALVDLNQVINDLNFIDLKKILVLFISLFVTPIGVFEDEGLAREIGVNINKNINASTGIGHIPLHTDFNNTSKPPLFSILYCHRTDPFKGGESIISNFNHSLMEMSDYEKSVLLKPIFNEGGFYNLFNVGSELNNFPILDIKSNTIRYSTKLASEKKNRACFMEFKKGTH